MVGSKGFVRLVGRRAALRYGLAGLAAAAVAACSGKGSTDVGSQTLVAFLEGRWEFKGESGKGAWVDVFDDGTYLVFGGDGSEWSEQGAWEFIKGGGLSYTSEGRVPYIVRDMPEEAEDALDGSYTVVGGLIDNGGQESGYSRLQVTGTKDEVVLTFPENGEGEPRVITCTRVPGDQAP
ncbi:hypothetical protein ACIQ8D_30725 [Streptomyces sp. NPDC096094]|uniref:hypothetical protein n=1 Tax=Streptomyces sp. NPDC096094 TaxID=3366073 RepID=UPI00382CC311